MTRQPRLRDLDHQPLPRPLQSLGDQNLRNGMMLNFGVLSASLKANTAPPTVGPPATVEPNDRQTFREAGLRFVRKQLFLSQSEIVRCRQSSGILARVLENSNWQHGVYSVSLERSFENGTVMLESVQL
ncbi:hypothetical protein TNCV_1252901 [Trichonephila clavipes]|nr:hypothetical protein TNCV_1252901 [Trichonephila clavipes]